MEVNEAIRKYNPFNRYTYKDYESWDGNERCELIDGEIYLMSAPSVNHQKASVELSRQLANFLIDKKCQVFASPFDVCLSGKGDNDYIVLQPDILVVCDKSKLDTKRCNGAPDLVIEIVSPSSATLDRFKKLNLYLIAGVREYWIVDPDFKGVAVHILENDKYVISTYESDAIIPVNVLDGCEIILTDVFDSALKEL